MMMQRALTVACACVVLTGCIGPPTSEFLASGARARGLQAGTWEGEWRNAKAGTSGTVRVTAMSYPGLAYAFYEISGDPFGCGQGPLQGTVMLDPGVDFTETGLTLDVNDPILGQIALDSKGRKVRGGSTGTCGGKGPSWDTRTRFRAKKIAGKVLLGGNAATGKVTYRVKPCTSDHCGVSG